MDWKVLLKKVSHLQDIADKNADVSEDNDEMDKGEPIGYTRILTNDIVSSDGHVHEIKYHPMPHEVDYVV